MSRNKLQADEVVRLLQGVQWDFTDDQSRLKVHNIHAYPAKFPPALPRTLVRLLSQPGDTVLDPFCGCGTTLVEALALGRSAIGVDANPIAWLVSSAKVGRLTEKEWLDLSDLVKHAELLARMGRQVCLPLGDLRFSVSTARDVDPDIQQWFHPHAIEELSVILNMIDQLPSEGSRVVARCALSSIIVAVSYQDSDTRYVHRKKPFRPGSTYQRFATRLERCIQAIKEFQDSVPTGPTARVLLANTLDAPDVGRVDVVITSPPYPNAWSYHLYHRLRLLWLGFDWATFKAVEIGSHRKYSRNDRSSPVTGPHTFEREMSLVFAWLAGIVRKQGYVCFVIGDSLIRGQILRNDEVLTRAAGSHGFKLVFRAERTIDKAKKSFIPTVGKIGREHVLVFTGG